MFSPRGLIDRLIRSPSKDRAAAQRAVHGPEAVLRDFQSRVPKYLEDTDQGKLIYPACKRKSSDEGGDVGTVWDHTRLEAMRYVVMVPGKGSELLMQPSSQPEVLDALLRQQPHDDTVIEFTNSTTANLAIAINAGFNWLHNCALSVGVDREKSSGTLRNFRKITVQAQQWWAADGAIDRCSKMLAEGQRPPLTLYLILTEYTRLAKEVAAAALQIQRLVYTELAIPSTFLVSWRKTGFRRPSKWRREPGHRSAVGIISPNKPNGGSFSRRFIWSRTC